MVRTSLAFYSVCRVEDGLWRWTFLYITVMVFQRYAWSYGVAILPPPWLCALQKSAWLCDGSNFRFKLIKLFKHFDDDFGQSREIPNFRCHEKLRSQSCGLSSLSWSQWRTAIVSLKACLEVYTLHTVAELTARDRFRSSGGQWSIKILLRLVIIVNFMYDFILN